MKCANKPQIVIIGDPRMGGLPYVIEPEDSDKWGNQKAFTEIWETIVAVIRLGYHGVGADSQKVGDGRYYHRLHTDLETPEGRLMRHLYGLARQGIYFPTHEVISVLGEIYSKQGLPAPVPRNQQGAA
jgi:hypothetical protein